MVKPSDAAKNRRPFPDRLRTLMAEQGLSQGQLAELAEIAPAGLSRILSGDRLPSMAQLLAIAPILKVTVAELVGGTTAEEVLSAWVPQERYDESERERLAALNRLEVEGVNLASRDAEIKSLRERVAELSNRNAHVETELAKQRGELELGRQHGEQLRKVLADSAVLQAENSGLVARVAQLEGRLGESHVQLTNVTRAFQDAQARFLDVRNQLAHAHNGAALAALLGGVFGAYVASSSTGSRRRG